MVGATANFLNTSTEKNHSLHLVLDNDYISFSKTFKKMPLSQPATMEYSSPE